MAHKRAESAINAQTDTGSHGEGEVHRHLHLQRGNSPERGSQAVTSVKGSSGAEGATEDMLRDAEIGRSPDRGARKVFVLHRTGEQDLDTPVFEMGESGQEEAVAVFSTREKAILYLQVANWQPYYEAVELTPAELGDWIAQARQEGIRFLAIDLNRQGQTKGKPQHVLDLETFADQSGDNLYHEVWERGNQ